MASSFCRKSRKSTPWETLVRISFIDISRSCDVFLPIFSQSHHFLVTLKLGRKRMPTSLNQFVILSTHCRGQSTRPSMMHGMRKSVCISVYVSESEMWITFDFLRTFLFFPSSLPFPLFLMRNCAVYFSFSFTFSRMAATAASLELIPNFQMPDFDHVCGGIPLSRIFRATILTCCFPEDGPMRMLLVEGNVVLSRDGAFVERSPRCLSCFTNFLDLYLNFYYFQAYFDVYRHHSDSQTKSHWKYGETHLLFH